MDEIDRVELAGGFGLQFRVVDGRLGCGDSPFGFKWQGSFFGGDGRVVN